MDLEDCRDYLENNAKNMLDLTIQLAEINSGSFNIEGLNRVAAIMQQKLDSLDCEHIAMPVAPFKHINMHGETEEFPLADVQRFWKRQNAPTQILIVGHMDTVFGPQHKFQAIKRVGGDILHGPGVADMKGGLVVLLYALKAFEQLPQAQNLGWELLLNADEEIGSPGSAEIIAFRARQQQAGFIFEPAMDEYGMLAGARKGSGTFTLVMRGKAAHAGRNFHEGRNAVNKMASIISRIEALNGVREGVTINVGFIHGGEAVNVVPDYCVCKINVRIPQIADGQWVEQELLAIVDEFAESEDYKLELHGEFHRRPKEMTPNTEHLYNIVKEAGLSLQQKIEWQYSGGGSDGNNLSAAGLANVDTLGVRGGKIHSSQEFLLIPSLVERAKLFLEILVNLSENGFNNGK